MTLPTATPVIESVALEIIDRLESEDMVSAGYCVVRPDREGTNISPVDRSIVIRQTPSTANMQLSQEGNPPAMAFDCVFLVVCSIRNVYGDANQIQYDTACNRAASDIIYALTNPTSSPSTWYTLDGNAINTMIGAHSPYISREGERAGVIVPVRVTYRVSENDHTVART